MGLNPFSSSSKKSSNDNKSPEVDLEIQSVNSIDMEPHALETKGKATLLLAFSTLGIIYSDIGTSPLYVLTTIWSTTGPVPSDEDLIGGVSAIFWAFTLLPLIKYVSEGDDNLFLSFLIRSSGPSLSNDSLLPRHS